MKKYTVYISGLLMLLTAGVMNLYAYPSGVSGRTLKGPNPGCTCHTGSVTAGVQVSISGPASLKTGETGNYTAVLTYSSLSGAGVDIAASGGTLSTTDTRLQVMNSELTHKSTNTGTGSITWNFKYTAPSTAGQQTLYATACGVKSAWNNAPNFTVNVTAVTSAEGTGDSKNYTYSLNQNYPNPFNPVTTISFSLKEQSDVTLSIYNSIGAQVEILKQEKMNAGTHSVQWNAANLPSGTYFYELKAGAYKSTKKLVLLK
ncbi:MAG: T9SS type A sorting domain-containing protein [Syntrophothermus sp.]